MIISEKGRSSMQAIINEGIEVALKKFNSHFLNGLPTKGTFLSRTTPTYRDGRLEAFQNVVKIGNYYFIDNIGE